MKLKLSETLKIGGKEMEIQEARAMISQYNEADFIGAIDFISCVLVHAEKIGPLNYGANLYKINSYKIAIYPGEIEKFKKVASDFIKSSEIGYNIKMKI